MHEEIYKENILDHYKYPHNKKTPESFDVSFDGKNPSCGDDLTTYLSFDKDANVKSANWSGDGCAVSVAGISMLTDKIKGMNVRQVKALSPGDIYNMLGITISAGRINCALLGYKAVSDAIMEYEETRD